MLLIRDKGSTLFAYGDTPNVIVTYNFWQEHRLIVLDPNRPRHFRLDTLNQEQLLAITDRQRPSPPALLIFYDLNEIIKKTYVCFIDVA